MPQSSSKLWLFFLAVVFVAAAKEEINKGHKGLLTLAGPMGAMQGGVRLFELGAKGEVKLKLKEQEKVLVKINGNHSQVIEYFSTAFFATCPADLNGSCLQN